MPNTWRVVYYNSQDAMILNSIEVVDMPEVACAARGPGRFGTAPARGDGMGEPDLTPGSPAWGDRSQVPPDARLECKICWWVYDPAEGDAVWQIPPGTAFADLPATGAARSATPRPASFCC